MLYIKLGSNIKCMCMHFIVLIIIMVRFNHYAQGMDGKAVLDLVMLYLNAVYRVFIENYVLRSLTFYDFNWLVTGMVVKLKSIKYTHLLQM